MITLIKVGKIGPVPSRFRKQWRKEARREWKNTGLQWHRRYRDKHFTHAGAREYGFAKRKGENLRGVNDKRYRRTYTGRKERAVGHTLPNVYSGVLRMRVKQLDIRPTATGVKMPLVGARMRLIKNSRIKQHRELTKVSKREQHVLVKDHERRMRQRLAAFRQRSDIRI